MVLEGEKGRGEWWPYTVEEEAYSSLVCYRQTDIHINTYIQTDRHTDIHIYRQTDRHTDIHIYIQTDRQTEQL